MSSFDKAMSMNQHDTLQALARPVWQTPMIPLSADLWVHPKAKRLPMQLTDAMVMLGDGSLLTTDGTDACVSRDDGVTWERHPLFKVAGPKPRFENMLIRCASGTVVFVYVDNTTMKWGWDDVKHEPTVTPVREAYCVRSFDEGRTWTEPVRIVEFAGCSVHGMQMSTGRIVIPMQPCLFDPFRNAQNTYVSDDEGVTWKNSNIIDLGGHGHHDGAIEGTVAELKDGRLWMLLRTNLDRFWQAFSEDGGLSWRTILPTNIDASSAPAWLQRLSSGRLMMAWNRLYQQGLTDEQRKAWEAEGGRYGGDRNSCLPMSSWHRNELSIAFSEDDGVTWSSPIVVARDKRLAYPTIIERRPGEIWITTRFSQRLAVSLYERDFV
jgi:hypothetical protein